LGLSSGHAINSIPASANKRRSILGSPASPRHRPCPDQLPSRLSSRLRTDLVSDFQNPLALSDGRHRQNRRRGNRHRQSPRRGNRRWSRHRMSGSWSPRRTRHHQNRRRRSAVPSTTARILPSLRHTTGLNGNCRTSGRPVRRIAAPSMPEPGRPGWNTKAALPPGIHPRARSRNGSPEPLRQAREKWRLRPRSSHDYHPRFPARGGRCFEQSRRRRRMRGRCGTRSSRPRSRHSTSACSCWRTPWMSGPQNLRCSTGPGMR
jgi:hypothetical protein